MLAVSNFLTPCCQIRFNLSGIVRGQATQRLVSAKSNRPFVIILSNSKI